MQTGGSFMLQSMFQMQLPLLEKILRPIIVYLCLIFFLRVFGKRELAQLNPFDLVVLLSLSNTVQNAIIGNDNSITGGIVGAFALLAINWILMRLLFKAPKVTSLIEGTKTILITDGKVDAEAMKAEVLTHDELISVLNKNGFNRPEDVKLCILEPNGTFYVEGITPNTESLHNQALMDALRELSHDVRQLRAELAATKG
jgi:uncharacterized membrane protein YcaP (DUF421 family)